MMSSASTVFSLLISTTLCIIFLCASTVIVDVDARHISKDDEHYPILMAQHHLPKGSETVPVEEESIGGNVVVVSSQVKKRLCYDKVKAKVTQTPEKMRKIISSDHLMGQESLKVVKDEDGIRIPKDKSRHMIKSKFPKGVVGVITSTSWRVPRNQNGIPYTGGSFNLDYAPPKVHPPSHN